jgi:RecB family exonuclease
VQPLLAERLDALASDAACGTLAGEDALRVIEEAVVSTRIPLGHFGDPAVYVGSVRGAVGLRFRAVRVIGLSEGHLPSITREDPVVPDTLREGLHASGASGAAPPTAADRALEDLHALDSAVRNADERIALSAPRLDVERSQREPSSVVLEAAAALGRPNRATNERGPTIPDTTSLRRDGFAPARETAAASRRERPLGEAAWQDGVSCHAVGVPPRWRGARSLDLDRVARLRAPDVPGPLDGLLGAAAAADLPVPGLTAERPISPSALAALLGCPHAFLLETILGFGEPACPPPQREIGQPYYGNLFHAVAAEFYECHGAAFCARRGALRDWLPPADEVVERAFAAFLRQYPLVGEAVRRQQRERLRGDLHELLEYDWERAGPGRRFVAAERAFGMATGVELPLGKRALFVRGRIDRLDVEGQKTLVRDLKTGRPYRRLGGDREPDPGLDLQIAVYGMVAQILAEQWKTPRRVAAAYAYFGRGGMAERSYRDDFHDVLEPEAQGWLLVAAGLLDGRVFPRTPNKDDCAYCCFRPVCGDGAHGRAAAVLVDADGVLAEFAALKGAAPADGEEG